MRSWLIRLAPIVLAVLQLVLPQAAGAAELQPCRESTRIAPRSEALPKLALARVDVRGSADRLTQLTPFLAAAVGGSIQQQTVSVYCRAEATRRPFTAATVRLPQSRAPPAQS